jgi:hopanoid biosynthesis associated protein HpnK
VKRLIVNADDFGLTGGVNRAIAELHRRGALTSATLMAAAKATAEAAAMAQEIPSLGVGCHVVLVDGEPVLPVSELPTLVDRSTGRFRSSLGRFVCDLQLGRIRSREIAAEAEAQIKRVRSLGVDVTHVDTHKHTHMFPRVLEPMLEAAKRQGVTAIRNPFEPEWSMAATPNAPMLRRVQVKMLRRFQPAFERLVERAGFGTTQGTIGVLATGTLDKATVTSLLAAMPEGTWELVTHPGYHDRELDRAGTRLLSSRETELDALDAAAFHAGIELIHFEDVYENVRLKM